MKITTNSITAIKNTIAAIGQLGKRAVTWIKSQFDGLNARIREFSIRFFTEVERTIIGRENYEVKLKLHAWVNDPSTKGMKAEAANRIFEAYRSKSTNLDLRDTNLNSLPTVIGDLTQLRSLDLGYNILTALPEQIGNLIALQHLYLSDNNLTALPEQIGNLIALQHLYLNNNKLTTLPEQIGNLALLHALSLNYNNLETLPDELAALTALKTLELNNNNLTTLPDKLATLTALKTLELNNNNLTTLAGVEQMQNLTRLSLRNNPSLKNLPPSLGKVQSLDSIEADQGLNTQVNEILKATRALRNSHVTSN